ncbi:MAG: DNA adenine methylase [Thiotrichaceae bacterium]|nr:DNA adenine methylase [Thiotrichaceae bacterium]
MKSFNSITIPHPFPYQGSKRGIAKHILPHFPSNVDCLIEPFCGASAISLSASAHGLAKNIILNDLNKPLMKLWEEILERPDDLVNLYEHLWNEQHTDKKEYFFKTRETFNSTHEPHHLLYLLARIVKGAVRYSSKGLFNQSADNRRAGMRPITMRKNIKAVSALLYKKTKTCSLDFREVVSKAKINDLIYMDPPYQGTSFTRDHRYLNGLSYDEFVDALKIMNQNDSSYIISYDGQTGNKSFGKKLPESLSLKYLSIKAGRSTQATFLGNKDETIESLYLSPALVDRLNEYPFPIIQEQQELMFA